MAGGIWTNQNKIRPGAYINFETESTPSAETGERGIATMAMELDWGSETGLIELTANDLYNGNSLAKVGFIAGDSKALLPDLALQNAQTLKLFRLNKNGTKASKELISYSEYDLTTDTAIDTSKTYYTRSGEGTTESPYVYTPVVQPNVANISTYYEKTDYGLTATAKYSGVFGNTIAIVISEVVGNVSMVNVQTYANGYLVDSQKISQMSELKDNNFVTFVGAGLLSTVSTTLLEGGTNGTVPTKGTGTTYTSYDDYFSALEIAKWNTMALIIDSSSLANDVIAFIQRMRDNEGKYVQAVVANHASVDYEGIINNINGVVINETTVSALQFTAWVAGATAGAKMNESLTGKVIPNATSVINLKNSEEIILGLQKGQFLLSLNQDGAIKVEKDINSLHTFTDNKSYIFSKNRVIRELDEMGSGIESIWENTYLGKVTNNDNGRTLFKSSIIDFLTDLKNNGSIDDFDVSNIIVEAGNDIDAVSAQIAVKPLDSMEFLYMTVNINR